MLKIYKGNSRFWVEFFIISIIPLNKFFYNNVILWYNKFFYNNVILLIWFKKIRIYIKFAMPLCTIDAIEKYKSLYYICNIDV